MTVPGGRRLRPAPAARSAGVSVLVLGLLATALALLVGAALKAPCVVEGDGAQAHGCYNDIQTLWDSRHLARHVFPYSGEVVPTPHEPGLLIDAQLGAGQVEYPVVTGLFIWLSSLPARSSAIFFVVSALALTPLALATAWGLLRLSGRRALLFAASPELVAFAFLNWDLLPVAATTLAVLCWRRGHLAAAGASLAVGANAKLWPGFLLLPLLVHLLCDVHWRAMLRTAAAFVGTTVAVNLPIVAHSRSGWLGPFVAQSRRVNDISTNSLWHSVARSWALGTLNLASGLVVLAAFTALLAGGLRARRGLGAYPWLGVGAAMVSAYMLLGRVDSPQYGLWLMPFLVMLEVPTRWVVLFVVSDVWLWLQWSWLWDSAHGLLLPAQILRWIVLAVLTVVFVRVSSAARRPDRATANRMSVPRPSAPRASPA